MNIAKLYSEKKIKEFHSAKIYLIEQVFLFSLVILSVCLFYSINIQILIITLTFSLIFIMLVTEKRKHKKNVKIFNRKYDERTEDLRKSNQELYQIMCEIKELKEHLVLSNKTAVMGHQAGGIAHDFNNLLQVVLGNLELAIIKNEKQNAGFDKYLINIKMATKHSKGLIDNLMAYCRSDLITSEVVNASSLLREVISLLSEVLPSSIEMQTIIDDSLPEIEFNRVQMQQIVTNLCINARDALDSVGKLYVYLRNQEVDVIECTSCGKPLSGKYVVLTIEDNGHGINNDDLKLIFQPSFTTKEVGKGTGLGLYVVNEIIHKYGGHIQVDSVKGKGTKFNVYFPVVNQDSSYYEKKKYGPDDYSELLDILN